MLSSKLLYALLLLCAIQTICSATSGHKKHQIDVSQYNVTYHDPDTGVAFNTDVVTVDTYGLASKFSAQGRNCECDRYVCTCCVRVSIRLVHFDRLTCTTFALESESTSVATTFSINKEQIFHSIRRLPLSAIWCIPKRFFYVVKFCLEVKFFIKGQNVYASLNLQTRLFNWRIFEFQFGYMQLNMGANTLNGSAPILAANQNMSQPIQQLEVVEPEVYDEVDFEQQDLEVYTSTLTPEEEAQIGQLKL